LTEDASSMLEPIKALANLMITCDGLDGSFYTTVPASPGCGLVGQVRLAPGVEFET
jgi:hypothetical protein